MHRPALLWSFLLSTFALAAVPLPATAQEQPLTPRKLAPGVLTTVLPNLEEAETFSGPLPLVGLPTVDFKPNYSAKSETLHEKAKTVTLRHPAWGLEFTYKPLRMMETDVPQPTGKMQRKIIWYMVYRVRNIGGSLTPTLTEDAAGNPAFTIDKVDNLAGDVVADRFFPHFVFEGWAQNQQTGEYKKFSYFDRVIPAVVPAIRQKEDPAIQFLNSIEMGQKKLPLSTGQADDGLWGVATWEDIAPPSEYASINFISVFVQGLTNAFRFSHTPDGKAVYSYKTLQINFWRPGDRYNEQFDTIHRGVYLVKNPVEQLKIFRLYQINGPMIAGAELDPITKDERLLFRVDAQINANLTSPLLANLNKNQLPAELSNAFAQAGVTLPASVTLTSTINKIQWEFQANIGGKDRLFRLGYDPQFWDIIGGEIKIRERLDYLWVYR